MSNDIVERLRIWPSADGKDGLASHFVESLMLEAAREIERLRREEIHLRGLVKAYSNMAKSR